MHRLTTRLLLSSHSFLFHTCPSKDAILAISVIPSLAALFLPGPCNAKARPLLHHILSTLSYKHQPFSFLHCPLGWVAVNSAAGNLGKEEHPPPHTYIF